MLFLLNAVTAAGAGSPVNTTGRSAKVQVVITGVATVKLQGSLDGATWFDIAEMDTSDGYFLESITSRIRGNVTSYSSGSITLIVEE